MLFVSHNSQANGEVKITIEGDVNQKVYKDILSAFAIGPSVYIDGYLAERLPPNMKIHRIKNDAGIFKISS